MKKTLISLCALAGLVLATPASAQFLNSGNSGLLGLGNNLLSVQTGHVSVLNGGILNGSNVLSGIGLGSSARASNGAINTTGSNQTVVPGNSGTIVSGRGNTVVSGDGNILGTGNAVGNQWGSNFYANSFNRRSW